jgi:hypothetical protein
MRAYRTTLVLAWLALFWVAASSAQPEAAERAEERQPPEYDAVLSTLGKSGDFKDGVLRVNVPRNDLEVSIRGRSAPTPLGFGGWVAFTKGDHGAEVMMGDLVLTEDEVNPVMSALLDHGLEVTALHNHFFWEEPRIFYLHVHGTGPAAEIARQLRPAIARIDAAVAERGATRRPPAATTQSGAGADLDTAALARIVGQEGQQSGAVYKITIGRPDLDLREHGAAINARMGLNSWAAFVGSDGDAMVAGDVAMLGHEVTPVLQSLRSNGIDVVAIHHHMIGTEPDVIFLHYYGAGPADRLAAAVRAAIDLLGKPARAR